MTPLFADTSFFVAFLSPEAQEHPSAAQYMATYPERILTTPWVLAELGNFLCRGPQRRLFAPFVRKLRLERLLEVLPADDGLFDRALDLYSRRPDKDWSMTDCISFVVMKERKLNDALTTDHHFEQAGFKALLRKQ